jgi:hypothetical protein
MATTTLTTHNTIRSIVWEIPSATRQGLKHTVSEDIETGARSCNCEASDHPKTRGRCWHLRAVASGLAGKPVVRITQRPSRPQFSDETRFAVASLDL